MAAKLTGSDRILDALVGLIILVATAMMGFVSIDGLYSLGVSAARPNPAALDTIESGWEFALYGSATVFGIVTLIFLIRLLVGTRSWTTALAGTVLVGVAQVVGLIIMASGL